MRKPNVIPAICRRKGRWTSFGTDANALAPINMENTVMDMLLCGGIDRQMRVVEVCCIAVREDHNQRMTERPSIQVNRHTPKFRSLGQREFNRSSRPR